MRKFSKDELSKAIQKQCCERMTRIIKLREPLEKVQALYINQAMHGGVDSKVQSLAQLYVNIGEGTFAQNWRQSTAMDMSFFDEEWFKLEESPDGTSEQILMDIMADYLRNCLHKPESNFYMAMLFAKLQARLLGTGAIAYNFACLKKEKFKRKFDRETTKLNRGVKEDDIIVYQGPQLEWLDMRNTYIDTLTPVNPQINDKDVYHRRGVHIDDLLDDETFQENEDYVYDEFCLYRSNEGLVEFKETKPRYELGYLERETRYKNTETTHFDHHTELRIAHLKRFKVGDETLRDVTIKWVYNGQTPIPLLVEENRFTKHRPIRLFTEWVNPFDDYTKTQLGFNYNASEWSNFLRSAQALAVVQAIFSPKLVPEEIVGSISETMQIAPEEIDKLLQGHPDSAGKIYKYKAGALNQTGLTADGLMLDLGKREAAQIIPLIQNERNTLSAEMAENAIDINTPDVSESTAKGIGFVETKQATLALQSLKQLDNDVLNPVLSMSIEDMAYMFTTEQYSYKLRESEQKELQKLNPDLQFVKARMGQAVLRDFEQSIQLGNDPTKFLKTRINTGNGSLVIELTAEAWASFAGSIRVLIEKNQYSKAEQKQWADLLTQLAASLPEDLAPMKAKLTSDLSVLYMELGKFPTRRNYDKFVENDTFEQMTQAKAAQDQAQLAATQAEVNKTNAQATKLDAEAKEEASRAMQQMQKVEETETIKQIAELESTAV